jgi:hypothetical protein
MAQIHVEALHTFLVKPSADTPLPADLYRLIQTASPPAEGTVVHERKQYNTAESEDMVVGASQAHPSFADCQTRVNLARMPPSRPDFVCSPLPPPNVSVLVLSAFF